MGGPRIVSSHRHALATFPDGAGGVLLDTESGGLYRLNRSGGFIWERLIVDGSVAGAERELCRRFGLSPETAARDVASAMAAATTATHSDGISPLWIHRAEDRHYQVVCDGRPVLAVDLQAREIAKTDEDADGELLAQAFRIVAAKVLAQEGVVLHASAVRTPAGILAVAGASGDGKTTTARALAAAGATLLSEDLVLLQVTSESVGARVGGEAVVRAWATEAAAELLRRPSARLGWSALTSALPPATEALSRLLFLGARGGDAIEESALEPAEATVLTMRHAFVSVLDPAAWRGHLQAAATLVCAIPSRRLTVPQGLERLAAAAPGYISNSTS